MSIIDACMGLIKAEETLRKQGNGMFKGVAFISGRFRGDNHWQIHCNVIEAEKAIPKLIRMNYIPYCPHTTTRHLQDLFPDDTFLEMCLAFIGRMNPETDIIYMVKGWSNSKGACEEHELAIHLGIKVEYE